MITSRAFALVTMASLGLAVQAHLATGATIIENFNNYGTVNTDLHNVGVTGGGWTGPWSGTLNPDYFAGSQVTFNNPHYMNFGNETGPDDGAAGYGGGDASGTVSRILTESLTGTIWISALTHYTSSTADTLIWLGSSNSYIAIRNGNAALRTAGSNNEGPTTSFAPNTTYLLLAKIVVNANGNNDDISFWVKTESADLSSEAALGTPTRRTSNFDAVGDSLSSIRLSFEDFGTRLDQLRISNDPDAFYKVTAIPEPAGLGLLGIGLAAAGCRRRR